MPEETAVATRRSKLTADDEKRFDKLIGPAQAGDKTALAELRPIVERAGMWPCIGNLARKVEESWLEAMTGRNGLVREGFERCMADMRTELLAAGDNPLERLLVERVVACWLQVAHADMAYATLAKSDSHTFKQGAHYLDRQDRAHARFIKATRTLATVRRLLVPAVQVNIADKQIITQSAGAPSTEAVRDTDEA